MLSTRAPSEVEESQPIVCTCKKCLTLAIELLCGCIGLLSMSLYIQPSIDCAKTPNCAKPFSDVLSEDFVANVLKAGGLLSFGVISSYFGFHSYKSLKRFYRHQKTLANRIVATLQLLGLCSLHAAGALISSIKTHATPLAVIFSVLGSVPTSLYSGVGALEKKLPYVRSQIMNAINEIYWRSISLTPEQQQQRLRQRYYLAELQRVKTEAQAKWQMILGAASTLELPDDKDIYKFLFKSRAVKPVTQLDTALWYIATFSGLAISIPLSLPIYWLGVKTLSEGGVPGEFLQNLVALCLNFVPIFANINVTNEGMHDFVTFGKNIYFREPLESLAYQLHPRRTLLNFFLDLGVSLISFSLLNTAANESYESEKGKDAFVYYVSFAIVVYHFIALLYFYTLILNKYPGSEKGRFLFDVQDFVEELMTMSLQMFMNLVEDETQTFAEEARVFPMSQMEIVEEKEDEEKAIEVITVQDEETAKTHKTSLIAQRQQTFFPKRSLKQLVADNYNSLNPLLLN